MSEAYTLMHVPVRLVPTIQGIYNESLVAVPTLGSTLMLAKISRAHHMSEAQLSAIWRGCLSIFHPDLMARAITESEQRAEAVLAAAQEPQHDR